jgi:hypothetical protein
VKYILVSLYEFFLKVDEVKDDSRHQYDVNAIYIMEVNDKLNTLARFKRYLQEEASVESRNKIERYLVDSCKDPNNDKLDILGWWKRNASKYKILSKISQHVLAISLSTVAFESSFSISGHTLNKF